MSGLAIRIPHNSKPVAVARAHELLDGIRACGADRAVALVKGRVEVAHAAFFTTPESTSERFPVEHPHSDTWVVADARLDYRDELRLQLRAAGCSFEPATDAEFILAAHEVWGIEAQRHLTGDFAYAVWDGHQIIVARDVIGTRAIYWATVDGDVVVASTLRCVLDGFTKPPAPNEVFIADLLASRLVSNRYTAYEGISRLEPGARLLVRPGQDPVCEVVDQLRNPAVEQIDNATAVAALRTSLENAVRERTRTLGPLACELSGGLDSSTIAGLAAGTSDNVFAISNVYPGKECDESRYIAAVVEALRIPSLCSEPLSMKATDLREISAFTRDLVLAPDQNHALWSLAHSCGARTVLTGFGGDETFATPDGFDLDVARDFGVRAWIRLMVSPAHVTRRSLIQSVKRAVLLRAIHGSEPFALAWRKRQAKKRRDRFPWMSHRMTAQISPLVAARPARGERSGWNRQRRHHFYTSPNSVWIYEHLHEWGAATTDVRHPFLDRHFLEAALAIPTEVLYPDGRTRDFHRRAFGHVMPPEVTNRSDKAEFSELYRESLQLNAPHGTERLSSNEHGWTEPAVIGEYAERFLAGDPMPTFALWYALTTSCWLDVHDQKTIGPDHGELS